MIPLRCNLGKGSREVLKMGTEACLVRSPTGSIMSLAPQHGGANRRRSWKRIGLGAGHRFSPSPPPVLDWRASQCCSPTRPTPTLQSSLVLAPFYPSSPLPPPSSFTLSARSMLPSSTITRWVNHFCQGLGCETNCVFYHPRWKTSILRWCTTSC